MKLCIKNNKHTKTQTNQYYKTWLDDLHLNLLIQTTTKTI